MHQILINRGCWLTFVCSSTGFPQVIKIILSLDTRSFLSELASTKKVKSFGDLRKQGMYSVPYGQLVILLKIKLLFLEGSTLVFGFSTLLFPLMLSGKTTEIHNKCIYIYCMQQETTYLLSKTVSILEQIFFCLFEKLTSFELSG